MTLFAITVFDLTPTPTGHSLHLETNVPVELTLHTQVIPPTRSQRWKRRRGLDIACGWYYRWSDGECIAPLAPGPHLAHDFTIDQTPDGHRLFAVLIESPTCTLPNPSGPPFEIPEVAIQMALPSAIAFRVAAFTLPGKVPLDTMMEQYGTPAWVLDSGDLVAPVDGIIVARGGLSMSSGGDNTYTVELTTDTEITSALDQQYYNAAPQGFTAQGIYIGPVHAGTRLSIYADSIYVPSDTYAQTGIWVTYTSLNL